jgi:hypothetical protein
MEEEEGRRGIPSLLRFPSPTTPPETTEPASVQQEHIASDITQVWPFYPGTCFDTPVSSLFELYYHISRPLWF